MHRHNSLQWCTCMPCIPYTHSVYCQKVENVYTPANHEWNKIICVRGHSLLSSGKTKSILAWWYRISRYWNLFQSYHKGAHYRLSQDHNLNLMKKASRKDSVMPRLERRKKRKTHFHVIVSIWIWRRRRRKKKSRLIK